jgi:hypothetical protein
MVVMPGRCILDEMAEKPDFATEAAAVATSSYVLEERWHLGIRRLYGQGFALNASYTKRTPGIHNLLRIWNVAPVLLAP